MEIRAAFFSFMNVDHQKPHREGEEKRTLWTFFFFFFFLHTSRGAIRFLTHPTSGRLPRFSFFGQAERERERESECECECVSV
jgi:hypothetical protein